MKNGARGTGNGNFLIPCSPFFILRYFKTPPASPP